MKKSLFLLLSMALFLYSAQAAPVDVNRAKNVGTNYVQRTLGYRVADLQLVYTLENADGVPCLYVFNHDQGYVVVAGDDAAQPILGYSEGGSFDSNHIADGEAAVLRHFADQISYAMEHHLVAEPEVAEAWQLAAKGELARGTHVVEPLIDLLWDQNYPYNSYCPTAYNGPGGHVYAGCVADAMAMVMKYWNWPDHGSGSHTYKPTNYPNQTANFEETYYDWNNMPVRLYSNSPIAQIQAVATLMWHCGIAVDMDYAPDGSGAHSEDVVPAISSYFRYTENAHLESRDLYTKTEWEDLLIECLDEGFPIFYAGQDSNGQGGHAYVCDGYNSNRYFHFNWGWSGSGNNPYYAIDALNPPGFHFNQYNRAIIDFIPDYIYNNLAPVPNDFGISTENANSKSGVITWTNPTVSVAGEPLTSLDSVTVFRNGQRIFTAANVTPGETMSCIDEVPDFDCYTYSVYYRTNGTKGRILKYKYQYGPTCTWKLIGQTTNFQGWNGGKIQLINQFGTVFEEFTMTSSMPVSQPISMPMGEVKMKWVAPQSQVPSLTITLKNSSNTAVYNYTGNSNGITAGVVYTGDNDCDGCLPPTNLQGAYVFEGDAFGALLTWEYDANPQSFKVYRSEDGVTYEEVATVDKEAREYLDESPIGSYYYKVTAYRNYCESLPAWTSGEESDYVVVDVTSVCEDEIQAQIYPNPANGNLNIQAEGLREVTVFNLLGQSVFSQRVDSNKFEINTSAWSQGVYTIRVATADGTVAKRVSILH